MVITRSTKLDNGKYSKPSYISRVSEAQLNDTVFLKPQENNPTFIQKVNALLDDGLELVVPRSPRWTQRGELRAFIGSSDFAAEVTECELA